MKIKSELKNIQTAGYNGARTVILKSCLLCLIFLLRKLVPVINGFEQVQKLQIIQILLGHKFFLVFGHH